jgi:hypothetical protein
MCDFVVDLWRHIVVHAAGLVVCLVDTIAVPRFQFPRLLTTSRGYLPAGRFIEPPFCFNLAVFDPSL